MNEKLRKTVHILFGLPVLLIPILPWWALLLIASAALFHNIFLFPLYAKSLMRSRFDRGIVYYPFSVLLLLILLKNHLALAGAAWALLSFADGMASLVGGKHPLAWNPKKSFSGTGAFILTGFVLVPLAYFYVAGSLDWRRLLIIEGAVLLSALFESLDLGFDDNLIVPFSFVVFFMALSRARIYFSRPEMISLGVVFAAFLVSLALGLFDLPGSLSALAIGAALTLFGGWRAFALLFTFLLISEAASFYKKGRKSGIKRGASNVWGKGVPALIFALLGFPQGVALALAQATFDTVATEIGSVFRVRGISARNFRILPSGSEGVWTLPGTSSGVLALVVFLLVGVKLGLSLNLPLGILSVLLANLTEAHFKACTTHSFANFLSCLFAAALYLVFSQILGTDPFLV